MFVSFWGAQIWRLQSNRNICHWGLLLKRKIIALEIRHIEVNASSRSTKIKPFRGFSSWLYQYLSLVGFSTAVPDVMSHVGWTNSKIAFHHLTLAYVLRARAPCDLLVLQILTPYFLLLSWASRTDGDFKVAPYSFNSIYTWQKDDELKMKYLFQL